MQIKVFKAGNMKDAMTAMKAELGEDAVILHSKKYKEGGILGLGSREVVEITAAVEETSMPKKPEPPRLKHPTVMPNSLLTRYKTDGTSQGVEEAQQRAEQVTQMDALTEKVYAQKVQAHAPENHYEDVLQAAQEISLPIDLSAQESPQPVGNVTLHPDSAPEVPTEETLSPRSDVQPVEETQSPQESPQPVEETQSPQESPQPVEETQSSQESAQPVEETQSPQESPQPVEETQSPQESAQPVEETQSPQESAQPVEETQSPQESPRPVEETQPPQQSPQPAPVFTQEQMAQTQAMLMAQFNQMQMMQQAAIAQAQAQAQAQAAEQIRLHQEQAAEQLRLQQEQVAEQLRLQQEQAALAQQAAVVQSQPAAPNEDKLKHLEDEIAQMKALLAEILGRDSKKGSISLHEALKRQEVDEEILTEMAAQSTAGETLVDIHTPAAKTTLTNYLNEHIKFSDGIKLNRHGVRIAALLGTTGVGKTTTLAKIAAKFVLEQRTNVALITADTYRISAVEQLKTYSDILELPLEIVYNPAELAAAIERHRDKELILIDTAGRSQHNDYQLRELEEFLRVNPRIEKHLVISSTTKFTDAKHIIQKFSQVEPDRIIFTKTDETGSLGMIINLLRDNTYSLSYVTTGQSVPDDIERANSDVLANLLFKKVDEQ